MATKIQQINPLDLRSSVGVGVNLPFTGKAVFNTTYTTREATKANLVNYFLTNKGERYLNPTFGSDIRLLLFENINQETTEGLKSKISTELRNFFPRVKPTAFEITSNPDTNTFRVYLKYIIVNSNVDDEILINIEQ
jgi:phage baseplate assembly protein W